VAASRDAASYATDEEARAESKWDTQGIEASYLAAGQAGQAREWSLALQALDAQRAALTAPKDRVEMGAMVTVHMGVGEEAFFIVPAAGGQEVQTGGRVITTLTRQAPLAARLWGKVAGGTVPLPNGSNATIRRVE
jgi:transcription elongation GreA/GreB family factor